MRTRSFWRRRRDVVEATLEEATLGPVGGELERTRVAGASLVRSIQPAQQVGPRRVVVPVLLEPFDRVDQLEAALDVARERDGDGVVQPRDRGGVDLEQRLVRALERGGIDAAGVAGRDR